MERSTFVLVPGAWMGAWIWQDMCDRLRGAGHEASTLTLSGLAAGTLSGDVAAVQLADHVDDVVGLLSNIPAERVVLVGHSYSGIVVGQVADRVAHRIARVMQIAAFLPRHGRSLLDDWGEDAEARAAERRQVIDDGMVWAPPPTDALSMEPDLTGVQRKWLAERFTPHPGRTVLDPCDITTPVTDQPTMFVATAPPGQARTPSCLQRLPARYLRPGGWRRSTAGTGR